MWTGGGVKNPIFFDVINGWPPSLFDTCGLIFMLSELLRHAVSCTIVDWSMKFKFFHKISVIQKRFLLLFNLLRGPNITRSVAGSGLLVVQP